MDKLGGEREKKRKRKARPGGASRLKRIGGFEPAGPG